MAQHSGAMPTGIGQDYEVTHPLRPIIAAGLLTLVLFIMSVAIIHVAVASLPLALIEPLTIYAIGYVSLWLLALIAMAIRRPDPEERVRVWGRITLAIMFGAQLACLWLIWGIMPFVSTEAQLLLAIPVMSGVPSQIISSPENSFANRFGVVAVLGSLAAVLGRYGGLHAQLAAIYVVGFAVVMFVLSDRVKRTVDDTVAARLASEAAAVQLERLLAAVAAERDAKTRFIAAASHDLGQPLQAAALFFDQSLRTTDETARAKAVEGVRRAFASADQLLSHMLGHLRLEADAVDPHPSRVAVQPLLARLAAQYTPAAEAARMTLHVAAADFVLMLDPVLVERAIGNLVHNAVQHSRGRRVLLAARRHGADRVRLWVIDDGVGVDRVDARHVFDDYYQGARAAGAVRSGFGLGLSSVRRIATIMGGDADIDRRWRGGAAFYLEFSLPKSVAAPLALPVPVRKAAA